MGLSPDEEDVFAAIVSELKLRPRGGIPWSIVASSVVVVGIAVAVAVLLGVHHHLVTLFYGTFLVALTMGLSALAISDKRVRSF